MREFIETKWTFLGGLEFRNQYGLFSNQFSIPTLITVGMLGLLDAWAGHGSHDTSHWCPLRITQDLIILSMTSNRLNTGNMITISI